ncbi:MAG TPA: DUF3592 domain-containing protein [Pyrinomonadaceae bacterium]|jgi:hypothetical protein
MGAVWRAADAAEGCWWHVRSGCLLLLLNLMWVAMLGAAYYYGRTSWALSRGGSTAEGTVVALKVSPATQDSGVTYAPVVRYEVGGRAHTFTSNNSSNPPAYRVGERVAVLYDPGYPTRARIDNWWELWLMPVLLGGAAVIVAVVVNGMAIRFAMRGGHFDEG